MAQGHKGVTAVGSILFLENDALAPRPKPGVEFQHSTRMAESGRQSVLKRSSLSLLCCEGNTA